ncbi:hypothetical protein ES677_08505 [Bizionia gelidisalsuginis]|uniref:Lipoprotein n=2 Tax=Bizionia TaxID=283785 RepID=A0A8H2LIU4_9FLAO|nr:MULTISPECIES: hypothetical protein [Bizionia]TYB78005.1 hypothetical protein ES676_01950 [Bizionia saleffrena]TYC12691.1 hypothetical protein ES677_08505 [Bizionia gelidisalsuginis]
MKTFMKTLGVLSVLFAFTALTSCEPKSKDSEPIKQEEIKELFAMHTGPIVSVESARNPEAQVTKGVIVGTKDEMIAFIDKMTEANADVDGDTPPGPQGISLQGHIGWKYHIYGPEIPTGWEIQQACLDLYYQEYLEKKFQYQDYVNQGCNTYTVTFMCPFNNVIYSTYSIEPTVDCYPNDEPSTNDDYFVYNKYKLVKYPFGLEDTSEMVGEFIEALSVQ